MLNESKNQMIQDNIGLVFAYLNNHHIVDEDEKADYICEFCNIIDKCNYDEQLGKLSTFVWQALHNYGLRRLRNKTALKRTLDETTTLPSLNETYGENENLEFGDIISNNYDYFGEVDLIDFIEQIHDAIKESDRTKGHKREAIFNEMIYAYMYNNGVLNNMALADKYGVSRQAIHQQVNKVREIVEELLWF